MKEDPVITHESKVTTDTDLDPAYVMKCLGDWDNDNDSRTSN